MKQITLKQTFRNRVQPNPLNNGIEEKCKRDDVNYIINGIEASDVLAINERNPELIPFFLNRSLELYAKDLFAENANDWEFVPLVGDVTLEAYHTVLTTSTRGGRILTKASLANFGEWYQNIGASYANKSPSAARNGAIIIADAFKMIATKEMAIDSFIDTFTLLSASDDAMNTLSDEQVAVFEALLSILLEMKNAGSIDVDDI